MLPNSSWLIKIAYMKIKFLVFAFLCFVLKPFAQTIPVFPSKPKTPSPSTAKPKLKVNAPLDFEMVLVGDFSIGKYEVTQAQWKSVMGNNPSYFKGDNLPVEEVSWNDVQDFLVKLNQLTGKRYRLPTESEWEYAAEGGRYNSKYEYAGSNDIGSVGWYAGNSGNQTHPVGQKQPNDLGIYDMSGNVWEWCSDWHDILQNRVVRGGGGSWSNAPAYVGVAKRDYFPTAYLNSSGGFRLALSL
jgi:formylglycine-generating enzyme required for sulfatase activity